MHKFIAFLFCLFSFAAAGAEENFPAPPPAEERQISTPRDSPPQVSAQHECARQIFQRALAENADKVSENDIEVVVQGWIYETFQAPDVVRAVLACPSIADLDEDEDFQVPPVHYVFPRGREIVVNYSTQPKLLKQRLLLNSKRGLPVAASEFVDPNGGDIWTNTDPAWYGILVVQAGALDKYVGEDKYNTLSLSYLENNLDEFYPHNSNRAAWYSGGGTFTVPMCTSDSALANDDDIVNKAAHKTTGEDDGAFTGNDYYIAGNVNLGWITWAELAADVVLTLVTIGGSQAVSGGIKGVRAIKTSRKLFGELKTLRQVDKVKDYEKLGRELKAATKAKNAAEIERIGREMKTLEKFDDVKRYGDVSKSFENVQKLRRNLRAWRVPQRGNIFVRSFKSMRAFNRANKVLKKANRVARAGIKSGKIRDWLYHSTLRSAGAVFKMSRDAGLIFGALHFIGGMYDWSETSIGDFTSNIEFKPLGLLSADDLEGQENVVNHGMWIMFAGDSVSAEDDDAAYLQAMDFAAKFHEDIEETQEEFSHSPGQKCDVDIYVVRPIIKNPGSDAPELFYLIMNDHPWEIRQ